MKLVPDFKDAWRWYSTRLMTVAAAFPVVWMQLPDDAKAMIPAGVEPWVPTVLIVAAMLGRVVDQK